MYFTNSTKWAETVYHLGTDIKQNALVFQYHAMFSNIGLLPEIKIWANYVPFFMI
jgi:hypothetical protein